MSVASGKEELPDRLLLVGLRFSKFVGFVKICKDIACANRSFIGLGILSYKCVQEMRREFETNLKHTFWFEHDTKP